MTLLQGPLDHAQPGASQISDGLLVLPRSGAPALVLADRVVTYAELDDLVTARAATLGATRRLILLECANALEPLVTYLAALRGRHPVLLLPSLDRGAARGQWDQVIASYRPDLVCTREGAAWVDHESRPGTAHDLHPDLAVLLGTSGSTGTPKLVRLSRENLRTNAEAIAGYLGLDSSSRAATTLPMQYCYGLSVVNSHLQAGGSLWLTGDSVVDPGFWDGFTAAGATSFAGVPYTFELLERTGREWIDQPGLRQITQAGGRLAPEKVRDLAERSQQRGVELYVMYGQTEATARMAYLPPALAAERPECIGVPIEGGDFRLDDGELVYSGPNVMLGYAEGPTDLALGATVSDLRTGDLAVQHDDGLFEIVGRANRIGKLYGVRLDLDLTERTLAEGDLEARAVIAGDRLHVFARDRASACRARESVLTQHCLPPHAVLSHLVTDFPLTPTGKPDLAALEQLAVAEDGGDAVCDVRAAFAGVFGCEISDEDSFLSLRGDSLSYVETYTRLERVLGSVPTNWPELSIAQLTADHGTGRPGARARRGWALLETPMVLRSVAIVLLVGAHVDLWTLQGGAHILLALFGYNLARFALASPEPRERVRAVGAALGQLLAPALVVVVAVIATGGGYHWPTALLLNHALGTQTGWDADWQLWFLEVAVWTAVALVAVLWLPGVRTAHRRWPFAVGLVVLGVAVLIRETLVPTTGVLPLYSPQAAAWCLLIGVVAAYADSRPKKVLTAAVAAACLLGFFAVPLRGYLVLGAIVLLLAVPRLPVPRPLDRVVSVVAAASLFIYLTHWRFYEHIEAAGYRFLALIASLVVGVVAWALWSAGRRAVHGYLASAGTRAEDLRGRPAP